MPSINPGDYWLVAPLIEHHNRGIRPYLHRLLSDFLYSYILGIGWRGVGTDGRWHSLVVARNAWIKLGVVDRLADADHIRAIDWREAIEGERRTGTPRGGFTRTAIMRELRNAVGSVVDETIAQDEKVLDGILGNCHSFEEKAFELGGARFGHDRAVALMNRTKANEEKAIVEAAKHWPDARIRMLAWMTAGWCRNQIRIPNSFLKVGQSWTVAGRSMSVIDSNNGPIVTTAETCWPLASLEHVPCDRWSAQPLIPKTAPPIFSVAPF